MRDALGRLVSCGVWTIGGSIFLGTRRFFTYMLAALIWSFGTPIQVPIETRVALTFFVYGLAEIVAHRMMLRREHESEVPHTARTLGFV